MWSCSLKNLDEMHPLDGNSTFLKSYHYLTNVPLNIRQELALSRTAGTHRRRIHAAPVHDFLLPGSAEASRLPPSLYSTDSEDAESGQRAGGAGGGEVGSGRWQPTQGGYNCCTERHSSPDG